MLGLPKIPLLDSACVFLLNNSITNSKSVILLRIVYISSLKFYLILY